jgi:small subunit ribosomal protein S9
MSEINIPIEVKSAATPTPAPTPAPTPKNPKDFIWGTGRRKTAVARVRIRPGNGSMMVNGRPFESYFTIERHRVDINAPLEATGATGRYDIFANINGGGPTGQAGAMRLGIARALRNSEPQLEELLREGGYLTRDSRMVERKKPGQKKARRRFQFSKR